MALLCSLQRARPGPLGWADCPLHDESLASTNCAMMIAHGKMLAGDLNVFDRMLKVIESQDRYRGFGHHGGAAPIADADAERACDRGLWKLVIV